MMAPSYRTHFILYIQVSGRTSLPKHNLAISQEIWPQFDQNFLHKFGHRPSRYLTHTHTHTGPRALQSIGDEMDFPGKGLATQFPSKDHVSLGGGGAGKFYLTPDHEIQFYFQMRHFCCAKLIYVRTYRVQEGFVFKFYF